MSFRQKNETSRKWKAFYQANRELMEVAGLPWTAVDTWDRFAYFLMHSIIDYPDDPAHFKLDDLDFEKRKQFRVLIERYFEAGFLDPGMHPAIVGGQRALDKLVKKYPACFSEYDRKAANEAAPPVSEEWWLDSSGLPDLLWARLTVYSDGSAEVLDLDGTYHDFASREEAVLWLREDEYSQLGELIEDGEFSDTITPPAAPSDAELVLHMFAQRDRDEQPV
jgi:hypothetical protein